MIRQIETLEIFHGSFVDWEHFWSHGFCCWFFSRFPTKLCRKTIKNNKLKHVCCNINQQIYHFVSINERFTSFRNVILVFVVEANTSAEQSCRERFNLSNCIFLLKMIAFPIAFKILNIITLIPNRFECHFVKSVRLNSCGCSANILKMSEELILQFSSDGI